MTDYISNINGNSLDSDSFSGQPVVVNEKVFSGTTFTANQWRTYSLSNILPNDDYDYEVTFETWTATGAASGNSSGIMLYSGTATSTDYVDNFNTRVCRAITRTKSNQQVAGCAILPIKANDKHVTVRNYEASGTSGSAGLYVKAFRRLGTNKTSESTNYISNINSNVIGGKLLDGQWVASNFHIVEALSLAKSTTATYDLSDYLPKDNYSYEVAFNVVGRTGTTSGNTMELRIGSPDTAADNIIVNKQITRASNYIVGAGNIRYVVGTDRTVALHNSGSATATNIYFYARAYRRVGTNSTTNIPNICIKSDTQVPNSLIYGNLTITNGVVSNFSENSYLQLLNGKQDNNAEYVTKFTTGSATKSTTQDILCAENFFTLEILKNTWDIITYNWATDTNATLFTANANTTYWAKILVNGNTKTFSYSTDGENYTQATSFTDNTMNITNSYPLRIGNHSTNWLSNERTFLGSVDLNETYINVNGERFWNGMDYKKYYPIGGNIADEQWVHKDLGIFHNVNLSNGSHIYTINNYLPEDNCQYEILVTSFGSTGTTSGNSATWWIESAGSNLYSSVLGYVTTRTASSMVDAKSAIITCVQTNGVLTLTINVTSSSTTGNCGLYFNCYRKLGTNE